MAQPFYGMLTAIGEAKDANAKALGIPLVYAEMAVGDGNGIVPVPDRNRTALVHQVRRAPLNSITRDAVNTNQVIAEQVIPENVGGWYIRELGLYDADGDLIAIANCPETYKPLLDEGAGRVQVVRMVIIVSGADNVQLKIDPTIILATRDYADKKALEIVVSHEAKTDPHAQYWNDTRGGAKIQTAVDAVVGGAPGPLDTLKKLADAINDDASFALTITQQLALRPVIYSISALPTTNKGPIIIAETAEVWIWSTSSYYTGYRSPLCGRPVDGHTLSPLASEIDAIGGVLSKTAYAGLWGYAQENGLVLTQANWTANIGGHYFVDVSTSTFRVPDLRNMFRRYTGADADTANARSLGNRQLDALQHITGNIYDVVGGSSRGASGAFGVSSSGSGISIAGSESSYVGGVSFDFDAARTARTSTETRGKNTAYVPRIHV